MEDSRSNRIREEMCLEHARQRAELLGLPPPTEPVRPPPPPPPQQQQEVAAIPSSPPPSYEHVLAETRLAAAQADNTVCKVGVEPEAEEPKKPLAESGAVVVKRPKILHKSSKELYRAVAAQWGITCKMSDHCRCLDCQSRYFDCEYEQNEQEKTDGGLGAGTPMFISEVIHGTACNIL